MCLMLIEFSLLDPAPHQLYSSISTETNTTFVCSIKCIRLVNHQSALVISEECPWGSYQILHSKESYQIKKLIISPGKRISMQSHKFGAETWFVVSGKGVAELN
jgi:hypothetical protein